eukprot:jgi/Hompol1/6126/HPOL_001609-RA
MTNRSGRAPSHDFASPTSTRRSPDHHSDEDEDDLIAGYARRDNEYDRDVAGVGKRMDRMQLGERSERPQSPSSSTRSKQDHDHAASGAAPATTAASNGGGGGILGALGLGFLSRQDSRKEGTSADQNGTSNNTLTRTTHEKTARDNGWRDSDDGWPTHGEYDDQQYDQDQNHEPEQEPTGYTCGDCGRPIRDLRDAFEIESLGTVFGDDIPYVPHQGKAFCEPDYEMLFLAKCTACKKMITDGKISYAYGRPFHERHLRCRACKVRIPNGQHFEFNNRIYCREDFLKIAPPPECHRCHRRIQGESMQALGKLYHRECFSCTSCRLLFPNKSFYVFDNEPYWVYYAYGGRAYCETDIDIVYQPHRSGNPDRDRRNAPRKRHTTISEM